MRKLKWVSLAVVLLLVFQAAAFAESDDPDVKSFEPTLTSGIMGDDVTAAEIMESATNRAAVTVLLWMDLLMNTEEDFTPLLMETSYVGQEGIFIHLYIHGEDGDLLMTYVPTQREVSYIIMEQTSDRIIGETLREFCTDGVYENDTDELAEVVAAVRRALTDDD